MRYIVRVDEQTLHEKGINTEVGFCNQMKKEGLNEIKWEYSDFGGCYFIEVETEKEIDEDNSIATKIDTSPEDYEWGKKS